MKKNRRDCQAKTESRVVSGAQSHLVLIVKEVIRTKLLSTAPRGRQQHRKTKANRNDLLLQCDIWKRQDAQTEMKWAALSLDVLSQKLSKTYCSRLDQTWVSADGDESMLKSTAEVSCFSKILTRLLGQPSWEFNFDLMHPIFIAVCLSKSQKLGEIRCNTSSVGCCEKRNESGW